MKIRFLLSLLSLALLASPSVFAAAKASDGETELELTMEDLNKAFRQLRRQVGNRAQNASSLELVATIRKASEASLTLKPAKAADIPDAQRKQFVSNYVAKLKEFIAEVGKLEAALKANDNARAEKIYADLGDLRKASHKEFKRDKDK